MPEMTVEDAKTNIARELGTRIVKECETYSFDICVSALTMALGFVLAMSESDDAVDEAHEQLEHAVSEFDRIRREHTADNPDNAGSV